MYHTSRSEATRFSSLWAVSLLNPSGVACLTLLDHWVGLNQSWSKLIRRSKIFQGLRAKILARWMFFFPLIVMVPVFGTMGAISSDETAPGIQAIFLNEMWWNMRSIGLMINVSNLQPFQINWVTPGPCRPARSWPRNRQFLMWFWMIIGIGSDDSNLFQIFLVWLWTRWYSKNA